MTALELLPCPFCGAGDIQATMGPVRQRWGTVCMSCGVWRDDRMDTPADAIAAWNTRTASTTNAAQIARLMEAITPVADLARKSGVEFARLHPRLNADLDKIPAEQWCDAIAWVVADALAALKGGAD